MMLQNKKIAYMGCLLIFFSFNLGFLKSQEVKIINQEKEPVSDVLLLKDQLFLGGISNINGILKYPRNWENSEVQLHKMSYVDTSIILKNETTYIIKLKSNKLSTVEVNAKQKNTAEKLNQFVNYNLPLIQSNQDTFFFDFEYQISIPSKHWKELRKGTLKLIYNSYHKKNTKVWNSEYCTLKITVDSAFWNSPNRKNFVTSVLIGVFEKDGIRKGRLLRKNYVKNKNQKNYNILQENTAYGYQFEIVSETNDRERTLFSKLGITKDKNISSTVGFNYDSTLSFYSYRWLNKTKEQVNAGLKKAKHNAHYSYIKYTNSQPFTIDSIHSKVGFVSKEGVQHQVDFKAKKNQFKSVNCIKHSFFLEFMPKEFKNHGLEKHIKYFE